MTSQQQREEGGEATAGSSQRARAPQRSRKGAAEGPGGGAGAPEAERAPRGWRVCGPRAFHALVGTCAPAARPLRHRPQRLRGIRSSRAGHVPPFASFLRLPDALEKKDVQL